MVVFHVSTFILPLHYAGGCLFWPAQRDFVPCCRTIASLRSLPRRRKCFPGAFPSAVLPPCSNPSVLLSVQKSNGTQGAVAFSVFTAQFGNRYIIDLIYQLTFCSFLL